MYYHEYHQKSQEIITLAKLRYPYLFDGELSDESIEVRYYLLNYLLSKYDYSWRIEKDEYGKPIPIMTLRWLLYWSVSHSSKLLAFIISDRPTGIDIAEYSERDVSVLDIHLSSEYEILSRKDWNNFYYLWTAKESIIKLIWWTLDNIGDITLEKRITGTVFEYLYKNKHYWVYSEQINDNFISYIAS